MTILYTLFLSLILVGVAEAGDKKCYGIMNDVYDCPRPAYWKAGKVGSTTTPKKHTSTFDMWNASVVARNFGGEIANRNEPTREGIPVNGSAPDINYGIVKPISPKKVVIPYDDFLKIIASKEHSDNLKNQCAAERAILVKLKDEQGKTISIQADQVKGLIETAEMQEKLGATESQINEALQVQLAKLTGDLDREKRLSRYKSEAVWVGVIVALGLWVVN